MADDTPPPPNDPPNTDRPEPRNALERFLRRFEDPTITTVVVMGLIVPTVALLGAFIILWLL